MERGIVIAVAILVLFPLGAVWLARRWRDPPREEWGIPAEQRAAAANSFELTEYRFRQRVGLGDERKWDAARKAVSRGVAASAELRPATHALAERTVADLDRRLARPRNWVGWAAGMAAGWAAAGYLAFRGGVALLGYPVLLTIYSVGNTPWWLRRVRARATAALAANA